MKQASFQMRISQSRVQLDGFFKFSHRLLIIPLRQQSTAKDIMSIGIIRVFPQNFLNFDCSICGALLFQQGCRDHNSRASKLRLDIQRLLKLIQGQLVLTQLKIAQTQKEIAEQMGFFCYRCLQSNFGIFVIPLPIQQHTF